MIRKILFLAGILFISVMAQAQEMKKVVETIRQMESELKILINAERIERVASMAALRVELRSLKHDDSHSSLAGGESTPPQPAAKEKKEEVNTEQLTSQLLAGNGRFVNGKLSRKNYQQERAQLTKSQHPYAMILSCSDSRVPPELLFDESLGRLFIIRTAGNVIDSVALGSIEYAAEHLHVHLLIVLGHEECGAVKATIAGGEVPPNIGSLVWRVKPAVDRVKEKHPSESILVNACVEENVRQQLDQSLKQSTVVQELVEKGELTIKGAVYSLETGVVRLCEMSHSQSTHSDREKVKDEIHNH